MLWFFGSDGLSNVMIIALVSLPLFTLTCLCFRAVYSLKKIYQLPNHYQVIINIVAACIGGLTSMLIAALICFSFINHEYFTLAYFLNDQGDFFHKLTSYLFSLCLSQVLLSGVWNYLYASITANRRIKEAEITALNLQSSIKSAKLFNLQNQLSPHFLFNSLNNIRFVMHENQATAHKMLQTFADMLQYALQSGQQTKIELNEEFAMVNRYIDIMQLQLEQRLRFEHNIQPAHLAYLLPPMTLQLLVENAIKHGIEHIKAPSTLSVMLTIKAEQYQLQVTGPIAKIKAKLTPGTQTGLANINQRLSLIYGDNASLKTEQNEHSFIATLCVPLETLTQKPTQKITS